MAKKIKTGKLNNLEDFTNLLNNTAMDVQKKFKKIKKELTQLKNKMEKLE